MIVIEINNQVKVEMDLRFLKKIVQTASCLLKIKKRTLVSVALVDKKTSQKINLAYRHINRPTDVLSFGDDDKKIIKSQEKNYLGEIIICYPLAKKQVEEYGVTVQKELARLLVHGLLHLKGYHHQTAVERKKMENLTTKILS